MFSLCLSYRIVILLFLKLHYVVDKGLHNVVIKGDMKKISQSERIVMEVLWSQAPMRATQIAENVAAENWNIRTVKTLLSRLVKKGVIETQKDGRHYLYMPRVSRESYAEHMIDNISKTYFKGRAAPLLLHLAKSKELSATDIDEITEILSTLKASKEDKS